MDVSTSQGEDDCETCKEEDSRSISRTDESLQSNLSDDKYCSQTEEDKNIPDKKTDGTVNSHVDDQENPAKSISKYRSYSPSALKNAYEAVKDSKVSVRRAAKQYGVPMSTLRDRISGKVQHDTSSSGPAPLFTKEEENMFVDHLKSMTSLGYGYIMNEIVLKATNFAVYLKKRSADNPLSLKWYRCFKGRWPDLKTSREDAAAQAASVDVIGQYFENLDSVLSANNLKDKPEYIYSVDEKEIQIEQALQKAFSSYASSPATSKNSSVTAILGCGNALGTQLPPYLVFKGCRMRENLLEGATPGTSGTVSETGFTNSDVYLKYLQDHFIKYIQRPTPEQPVLLILDGHKSHINVPVIKWAKDHNVILAVLPAHTSYILQPLEVGCFAQFQQMFNALCHKCIRDHPTSKISRNDVCRLICDAYAPALSIDKLRSAFLCTGISPFKPDVVTSCQVTPSIACSSYNQQVTDENENNDASNSQLFFEKEVVVTCKQNWHKPNRKNDVSNIVSDYPITVSELEKQIDDSYNNSQSKSNKYTEKRKQNNRKSANSKRQKTGKNTHFPPQPGSSGLQVISVNESNLESDNE